MRFKSLGLWREISSAHARLLSIGLNNPKASLKSRSESRACCHALRYQVNRFIMW